MLLELGGKGLMAQTSSQLNWTLEVQRRLLRGETSKQDLGKLLVLKLGKRLLTTRTPRSSLPD